MNFFLKLVKVLFFSSLSLLCTSVVAQRQVTNLQIWQFLNSDRGGAELIEFDDNNWRTLNIPHDWAIEGKFDINHDAQLVIVTEDKDTKPRLRTGRTGALPSAGIGWYRTSIGIDDLNKNYELYFDGAMSHAKVYVNGKYVGERPYGYSAFYFDISAFLKIGDNKIAVRLENFEDQSRWYTGGGLYREVTLIERNPTHVPTWGIQITTPEISKSKACVKAKTNLVGTGMVDVTQRIKNAEGVVVAEKTNTIDLSSSNTIEQEIKVKKPKLWSPKSPNLYYLETVVTQNNKEVDITTNTFGIRSIDFRDDGFYLNEEQVKLKGVCLHHDLGPLGTAFYPNAFRRQVKMLKEMGVNAIRFSHNPSASKALDICDELGVLVIAESFDEWKKGKTVRGYNLYFDEWAERDMKDLVKRDFNHPSIIMWSIGNEVKEQNITNGATVAKLLHDFVKEIDITRPTTAGYNEYGGAIANKLTEVVDIVGWNYKPHLYDKFHQDFPKLKMYAAESASAVDCRGIYKFPFQLNDYKKYDDLMLSAYGVHAVRWGSIPDKEFALQEANPFIYGEFVWTGYDYIGEPSPYNEDWPTRSSYFGIIDLAGIPKDRYYLYQSHWSDTEKVLHILPHWTWEERVGTKTPVMCFTNYDKVELFVNGKSMGIQSKQAYDGKQDNVYNYNDWSSGTVSMDLLRKYRIIWEDVTYEPGEIKVIAYDKTGKKIAEEIVKTAGTPYRIRLTPEERNIATGEIGFIRAEVVDENGVVCPKATNKLSIKVSGTGVYKAAGNGDPTNLEPFTKPERSLFSGAAIIYIEAIKQGKIMVEVNSENLVVGRATLIVNDNLD